MKSAGAKKFAQRFKTRDDLTRATQAWGTRALHLDSENDTYLEEITLHDGTRIDRLWERCLPRATALRELRAQLTFPWGGR